MRGSVSPASHGPFGSSGDVGAQRVGEVRPRFHLSHRRRARECRGVGEWSLRPSVCGPSRTRKFWAATVGNILFGPPYSPGLDHAGQQRDQ